MTDHFLLKDSQLGHDIITLDVPFEQLRAWLRYEKYVTKKELIELVHRIKMTADHIEYQLKKSGFDYMDKKVI